MGQVDKNIPGAPSPSFNTTDVLYYAHFEVPTHTSKKNSWTIGFKRGGSSRFAKRTGYSPLIRSSDKSRVAQQLLLSKLQDGVRSPDASFPLRVPMLAVLVLESPKFLTKKGQVNLKGGDVSNLAQTVEDALQKAGIIVDDALLTTVHLSKRPGANKVTVWLIKDSSFVTNEGLGHSKNKSSRKRRNNNS